MRLQEPIVLLLCFLMQVLATRITMDEEAQNICKKYKMMCKTGKICAVQHFDWSKNITIPVCIPLSFVPVRNMVCELPPEVGQCGARYIRWYYNKHSGECTFFRFSGCNGNQNNFRSKADCHASCMSTPHINLYGGGEAALVESKPAVVTSPIYQRHPPKQYEALNSVMVTENDNNYNRYPVMRNRRINTQESNTTRKRRRLDKERAKERKRRERRKERKRVKKLRRKKKKMLKLKSKRGKRRKQPQGDTKNETSPGVTPPNKHSNSLEEVRNVIADAAAAAQTDAVEDAKRLEKRRKRKKRRQRRKRRLSKDRKKRRNSDTNGDSPRRYQELVGKPESVRYFKRFSILDQDAKDGGRTAQANSLLKTPS